MIYLRGKHMNNFSANKDVSNLFHKFGGDARNYQEIRQGYHIQKARNSWPIVAAMENSRAKSPKLRSKVDFVEVARVFSPVTANESKIDRAEVGAYQFTSPERGMELQEVEAASLQPVQFGRNEPLYMVFSRLLGKKSSANI
jgi:hypothetical protein